MIIVTFKKSNGQWSHSLDEKGREYSCRRDAANAMIAAAEEILMFARYEIELLNRIEERQRAGDADYGTWFRAVSSGRFPLYGGRKEEVDLPLPNASDVRL